MTMRLIGGYHTLYAYYNVWSRYYTVGLPPVEIYKDLPDGVSILDKWVIIKKRKTEPPK